jgi:hypothetical protein
MMSHGEILIRIGLGAGIPQLIEAGETVRGVRRVVVQHNT